MIRLNGAMVMLACALVFSACGGDKKEACEILKISLKTLYNKLHEYEVM